MRTATQVLLILPATVIAPIGWLFILLGYSATYDAPAYIYFAKAALFFGGSLVGLIALWHSIFTTRVGNEIRPSRLMIGGLIVGLLLDAVLVFGGLLSPPHSLDAPLILSFAWIIVGPFAVGIWNLVATFKAFKVTDKMPDKMPIVTTRMTLSDTETQQLQTLEREVEEFLARAATASQLVPRQTLKQLESCVGAAAKIAFGSGNPQLLSEQMSTLIAWTDHLDDSAWIERFQQALMRRPLVSPWKR